YLAVRDPRLDVEVHRAPLVPGQLRPRLVAQRRDLLRAVRDAVIAPPVDVRHRPPRADLRRERERSALGGEQRARLAALAVLIERHADRDRPRTLRRRRRRADREIALLR